MKEVTIVMWLLSLDGVKGDEHEKNEKRPMMRVRLTVMVSLMRLRLILLRVKQETSWMI